MRLRTLLCLGALALLLGVLGACHHLDWSRRHGSRHGGWHEGGGRGDWHGGRGGHDRGHGHGGWR